MISFTFFLFLFHVFGTEEQTDTFLADWQSNLLPIISNVTLCDLTFPGTHDTLTYDLSTTISDGGMDDHPEISDILHYASEVGLAPSHWIKYQAQTQGLPITSQLENGVRFIDFRMMYTSKDWYGLHFVQTNSKSIQYLNEIRSFLDSHPKEIIVMELTRHGGDCENSQTEYPDVSHEIKLQWWLQIKQVFKGILFDRRISSLNETTYSQLLERDHRVVLAVADYENMTNSDPSVFNACYYRKSYFNPARFGDENFLQWRYDYHIGALSRTKENNAIAKQNNQLYAVNFDNSLPQNLYLWWDFLYLYSPVNITEIEKKCSAFFQIPGIDTYCPPGLADVVQVLNFYITQNALDEAYKRNYYFPNIIYVDAIDVNGTIRTGTKPVMPRPELDKFITTTADSDHEITKFAFVYSLLSRLVQVRCADSQSDFCGAMVASLKQKREMYPSSQWNDTAFGRMTDFPKL